MNTKWIRSYNYNVWKCENKLYNGIAYNGFLRVEGTPIRNQEHKICAIRFKIKCWDVDGKYIKWKEDIVDFNFRPALNEVANIRSVRQKLRYHLKKYGAQYAFKKTRFFSIIGFGGEYENR